MTDTNEKKVHQGRNVKRFREMLRLTQDGLAAELGEDWTQRRVSLLEGKEEIEGELLEQVARALQVSPEAIKNFTDEAAVNYFNTFNDSSVNQGAVYAFNSSFHPMDKVVELYERMLKEKNDTIERLEKLLAEKK